MKTHTEVSLKVCDTLTGINYVPQRRKRKLVKFSKVARSDKNTTSALKFKEMYS